MQAEHPIDISGIPEEQAREILSLVQAQVELKNNRKIDLYYPETGSLSRHNYPKHMRVFSAGVTYRERGMVAANRVGKSEGVGAYETALHLTGQYPEWWTGRKYTRAINSWACGDTNQTVRDIAQFKLLGKPGEEGSGMIPRDCILDIKKKHGTPDAVETVIVKHVSGGSSRLVFKAYEQGRKSFQGVEQDFIWVDEEPPMGVYGEIYMRTTDVGAGPGMILLTFTPLLGVSDVVLRFMPDGKVPAEADMISRFVVNATWDDAPHLSDEEKQELWENCEPHLREARAKGVPSLGSGAIYPIHEGDVVVDDFEIPDFWPRAYALDVGWNCTAALWGALDIESDVVYLYSAHKQGKQVPAVHSSAIKSRGDWIPGVADPGALGKSQVDGKQLLYEYINDGLDLVPADNAVEAGLHVVWSRLSTGRLRVFKSLTQWFNEFRLYRRDENGQIVKKNDHLMDCTRYLIKSGIHNMKTKPQPKGRGNFSLIQGGRGNAWMSA